MIKNETKVALNMTRSSKFVFDRTQDGGFSS